MMAATPSLAMQRCLAGMLAIGSMAPAVHGADITPPVTELRVCADPDNLPFSHANGTGFENRIAQLIADDFGVPLSYEWLPDRRGFVRKTLGARLCDVIIGVPTGFERAATTRPYYRSSYVLVQRAALRPPVQSFDDPRLRQLRIGVQLIGNDLAASPPAQVLARQGVTNNGAGYAVPGEQPASERAVRAIEQGELDAALLWGPPAGYFAGRASVPMRITVVHPPADMADVPFDYAIAIGTRRPDAVLRERLDDFIRRRQADIDRILDEYAVPRVAGAKP
jgi:mxaJ protein